MKITFIETQEPVKGFNSGLAYISSVLRKISCNVNVIDLNNFSKDKEKRLRQIKENKPDIIGISVKLSTLENSLELLNEYKNKEAIVIAGGPEVTIERENFFNQNNVFNYAFMGETEKSIVNFISFLQNGADIKNIKGLIYRNGKEISSNEPELIENLDELDFPDYSVFDSNKAIVNKYPLVTSRGCPYKCIYCAVNKISGKRWRSRSPDNVVEELYRAKKEYAIRNFEIVDDNFTMDIDRAKEICRLIINRNIRLSWTCINGIRADRIDDELFKLMSASGCEAIWFGIESLNPDIFNSIKKGEKVEDIKRAIILAKKNNITVNGFFIVGLPGSTYKEDQKSLKESKSLKITEALWSIATPLPNTEMWEWVDKNGRRIGDYKKATFYKLPIPTFETNNYTSKERMKMFYLANVKSHCYSIFFPEKIKIANIFNFIYVLFKYDTMNLLKHFCVIIFGKHHRKYIKEFFKRIFNK